MIFTRDLLKLGEISTALRHLAGRDLVNVAQETGFAADLSDRHAVFCIWMDEINAAGSNSAVG